MDYKKRSLELHKRINGKIEIISKVKLRNKKDLSLLYTPGVAEPCLRIKKNVKNVYDYTLKQNTVAIVTDGSAVLGLGNLGAEASIPVMEGKSILFKRFANINAFPIALKTQKVNEIVNIIKNISPVFGGINLEDISAPRCFEIEEKLKKELNIPVFHDDQHGTAIVVLAALINASKVVKKKIENLKVIVNGAGAAGIAITKILLNMGIKNILVLDSKGILSLNRKDIWKNKYKVDIAKKTNKNNLSGTLKDAIKGRDVFIGVSKGDILTREMVKSMNSKPIVFAMANPNPEISYFNAKKSKIFIFATGRSDYPNQINNVLAFPGIFKGALESGASEINEEMKIEAAKTLAELIKKPSPKKIIPSIFEKGLSNKVAKAVKRAAINSGVVMS